MQLPNYFVLDQESRLHAYYREDILRGHLAINRSFPPQQIFRLSKAGLSISYDPITAAEIPQAETETARQPLSIAA